MLAEEWSSYRNGQGDIVFVKIEKEVVDPEDIEMLEDLSSAVQMLSESRELANSKWGNFQGLGSLGKCNVALSKHFATCSLLKDYREWEKKAPGMAFFIISSQALIRRISDSFYGLKNVV